LDALRGEGCLVVVTGAGVSAESGLATFRGPDGLWEGRDPATLATPEAFEHDPEGVWRFYAWRRAQAAIAKPNPAHLAIASLETDRNDFLLVTQNVDGLHARAGNERMVELHGTLWKDRCSREGIETEVAGPDPGSIPPRCAGGALLRPAVVWFGEALPEAELSLAVSTARRANLVLVVGTSGIVYPAASIPVLAAQSGAWVVEINPERTPLSELAHERFEGLAGEILPRLLESARGPSEIHS